MKPEQAFGHVLKMHRTKVDISQEQLALKCNLDRTFISMLERGKRQPSLSTILSLSKILNVPADQFIKQTMDVINENTQP